MKIVEAVWEKRNLGVSCYELTFESSDSLYSLEEALNRYSAQYVVLKIPAAAVPQMQIAHKHGFMFMESLLRLRHPCKDIIISDMQRRILNAVSYAEMNDHDFLILEDELSSGIFQTDRIALDPAFSQELGNKRYIGWIKDAMRNGAQVYKITYKDDAIGFFALSDDGVGCITTFLGGLYNGVNGSLGTSLVYCPMVEIQKRCARMITAISTNNVPILRLYTMFGFYCQDLHHVFVKHS